MKVFLKLVGALALTSTLFFSCASTSGQVKDGKYIGQYDETMTPENSCVIFFSFQGNQISEFKQINTKKDIDTQSFEYGLLNIWDMTVFKPCKPGSRYMLTKFQGSIGGGWSRDYWDMELKPSEQYLVIDVPNEPGIYCFEIIRGDSLAIPSATGKNLKSVKPTRERIQRVSTKLRTVTSKDFTAIHRGMMRSSKKKNKYLIRRTRK